MYTEVMCIIGAADMHKPCETADQSDRVRHLINLLKCASKNLCPRSLQCTEQHIEHLHHETKGTSLVESEETAPG